MSGPEPLQAAVIASHLLTGRARAVSVAYLSRVMRLAPSTIRARIHEAQAAGFAVLSSPLAGVWIAADDGERLDVIEELRAQVQAIERRMAAINQGKCALRTCRAELPEKVVRRGGLYCSPGHRYQAAADRTS